MIIPSDCSRWSAGSAPAEPHAEFADNQRLHASGCSGVGGVGERTALLMECFAGKRPWRGHLDQAARTIDRFRFVCGPPNYSLDRIDDHPGVLLKLLLLGEITTVEIAGQTLAGLEAKRTLARWLYDDMRLRAEAYAEGRATVLSLQNDPRAVAMEATPIMEAALDAQTSAACHMVERSRELSCDRAWFTCQTTSTTIELTFIVAAPEEWSTDWIDKVVEQFMTTLDVQLRYLTFADEQSQLMADFDGRVAARLAAEVPA